MEGIPKCHHGRDIQWSTICLCSSFISFVCNVKHTFNVKCYLPSLSLSFSRIGTVTAIPISIIVDYIINRKVSNILVYIGMLLIGVGFVKFCISEVVHLRQKSKRKKDEVFYRLCTRFYEELLYIL